MSVEIKITEGDLRKLVKENIRQILNDNQDILCRGLYDNIDVKHIVSEVVKEEIEIFGSNLFEGVDFDYRTKTVSYNPSHQNNVDTSLENNHTCDYQLIKGVDVWSIFKRKRGLKGDGNPLVYALKNEGWKFASSKDRNMIDRQFKLIAEKFVRLYPVGLTIVIPSGSYLNKYIANTIAEKSVNIEILEGAIVKLTTDEVNDIVLDNNSLFKKKYSGDKFDSAYRELCKYFRKMDMNRNHMFSRHLIKDPEMRDILMNTLKVSEELRDIHANKINGRDVLVIDDTISRGQTIMEACLLLDECYSPKSITVLTLFSKNY